MTTRETLTDRLLSLPDALQAAEADLLVAEAARRRAESELQDAEDTLILTGNADGRNAEVRAAQLRSCTLLEREALAETVERCARLRARLHALQAEHASLRACARLMSGGE